MLGRRALGIAFVGGLLGARALHAQGPLARPVPFPPKLVDTRIVIAMDHRVGLPNLPLTVAQQLNFFREEGLDIELRDYADTGQAMAAVLAKEAHVLSAPFTQLLNPALRESMWQSFVVQARAPQVVLGVSTRTLTGYRNGKDLRGRRVGCSVHDDTSRQLLSRVLQRDGVGEAEIQLAMLANHTAALQAFRAGQLDALCHADPVITQLEQSGELRVVADARNLRGTHEVFGGPLPVGCLSAPAGFVEQFPRLTQALTDAMVHALKWLQTAGPSDLIKTVPEGHFQGDRALYLASVERSREAWTVDGLMPKGGPEAAARALGEASIGPVDLARRFTNVFAAKAKERFRA
ncbi:MAG: ABC transporter substrate-binding protein [Hydrogenophaga sp.]|uniref:ABC transporter substrate-binding protein n=1 Tax=Hydrogenophaga sp. TaxID=1904254 RepID=UPI001D90B5F2|nr:ABC transporter substrate-binding protein [Hydrogenophaga sp.]MBX3611447.1 ABC transporter substrate-binding protein [Hydrogenophaga sp.]